MTATASADRCVRAITNDGGFRLVTVVLETTAADAAHAQDLQPPASESLAELLVGAILLRETTSPARRVQLAMRERSGSRLVADSLPDGLTRGLATPGSPERAVEHRSIDVTYTQRNGALHKGIVQIEDETDISAAMMTYLQESEQILSTLSVAARAHGDKLTAAGFVVQLLPELERSRLNTMTERLAGLQPLAQQLKSGSISNDDLVSSIFAGFEFTLLADSEVRFGCNCTRERFIAGIGTLPQAEIDSMIEADEPLELRCDACGKSYRIEPSALADL